MEAVDIEHGLMDRVHCLETRFRNYDSLQTNIMRSLESHLDSVGPRGSRGGDLQIMSLRGDMEVVSERLDEQAEILRAMVEQSRLSRNHFEQVLSERPTTAAPCGLRRPSALGARMSDRSWAGGSDARPKSVRLQMVVMGPSGEASDCCSICLEAMSQGQELGKVTSCSHQYHWACIRKWVARQGGESAAKCPLCKCSIGGQTSPAPQPLPRPSSAAAQGLVQSARGRQWSVLHPVRQSPLGRADSGIGQARPFPAQPAVVGGSMTARMTRVAEGRPRDIVRYQSMPREIVRYFPSSTLARPRFIR